MAKKTPTLEVEQHPDIETTTTVQKDIPTETPQEGLFRIEMKYNDEIHTAEDTDVIAGIMSLKPTVLKTRVLFHIEKEGKKVDLFVHRIPALQLFRNRLAMTVFTNRIILK